MDPLLLEFSKCREWRGTRVLIEKSGEMGLINRILINFLFVVMLCGASYGGGYALMIQQSPSDGGVTSPSAGVHKMDADQTLPLLASPKPGYRFVGWLGDVNNTATKHTSTQMDSPKIVVAVFEPIDDEIVKAAVEAVGGAGATSGGGLIRSPNPIRSKSSFGGGSSGGGSIKSVGTTAAEEEPIPEPATGFILVSGILFALRRKVSKQ